MQTTPAAAFLAVDLGSSSGRVMLGILDAHRQRMTMSEVVRFTNRPVPMPEGLGWDLDALWEGVLDGLADGCVAAASVGADLRGIGVDSWGVDYVRLRADGGLRPFARHHRDVDAALAAATSAGRDLAADYASTRVLDQAINTAHQLRQDERDAIGADDDTILPIADAFVFSLTGTVAAERSLASTTALVDRARDDWSPALTSGIRGLLPPLADAGGTAGRTTPEVTARIGASAPVPVWFVTAHDTAAAFSAVGAPAEPDEELTAVVACGSWAVAGVTLPTPLLTESARRRGFTQEIGAEGATLLVRNLSGMWLLQQATREWAAEDGRDEEPAAVLRGLLDAAAASHYPGRFDPADPALQAPGGLVERLVALCAAAAGAPPSSRADVVRAIVASLASAYARTVADVEELTGRPVAGIRLVGGGARGDLLCALTAQAAGRPVLAGPAEASVRGVLLQLAVAAGDVADLAAARAIEIDDGEAPARLFPAARTASPAHPGTAPSRIGGAA
jgi:rhamnulokinase